MSLYVRHETLKHTPTFVRSLVSISMGDSFAYVDAVLQLQSLTPTRLNGNTMKMEGHAVIVQVATSFPLQQVYTLRIGSESKCPHTYYDLKSPTIAD